MSRTDLALSRRRFLELATAAAAAASIPDPAWASPFGDVFDDGNAEVPGGVTGDVERVVVIGAGFAGLAAANALANAGVEVVVVEGRDRIGGRAKTSDVVGNPVDQGCQWIHSPVGNPMSRWAQQLGVPRVSAAFEDDIATFTGYDHATGALTRDEIIASFFQTLLFDSQAYGLRQALGERATLEDALQLFLQRSPLPPQYLRLAEPALRFVIESGSAAPANDLSLDAYVNFPAGPNYSGSDVIPVGGYRTLYEPLAAGLDIRLRHRVTRIETAEDGVLVHVRKNGRRRHRSLRIRGSHVVVTLPLGVLKDRNIGFAPLLPVAKTRAIQRLGLGFLEKVSLGFAEPFWQEGGKTHFFHNSATPGEFPAFLDLQQFSGFPVLQGFVGGDFGRRMSRMRRPEILDRTHEILQKAYGPSTPRPLEALVTRWFRDPYSRGSYSSFPVGAQYEDLDRLAEPVGGRMLFAGEATHPTRSATADGAFSSGVREAKRLLGQPSVRLCPLSAAVQPGKSGGKILSGVDRWRREAFA